MFSWDETHTMPTIGDVYMAAKLSYGNRSNSNKLQFLLLGDPAIKVRYPKPLFKIQKINNKVPGTNNISTAPLQELTIEAQVMNEDGITPNTSFNGEAYITIYDKNDSCKTTYQSTLNKTNPRTVYYPREALVKVQGTVVNGLLQATVVMPRHVRGVNNKNLLISVYAHDQATHEMVNGSYDNLMMGIYNTRTAVQDTEKPVIEALYLNDETSFATNAQTGSDAILYLRATDNVSFNTQLQPMGNGISVMLDGGKSTYNLAKNMVSVTDNGRTLNLVMPLNGLTAGRHTLTVNLGDIAGNHTMQTISFVVSAANDLTISTDSRASCTEATIDLSNYSLSEAPNVNLKISDIAGNIVWSKTTSSFPCTWNLTDDKGQRVKPGLYQIYGNYENEEGYGGTNIQNFIVLEPLKSNK